MRVLVTLTHVQALEQTYPGEMQPHAECTPAQGWDTAQGRHCGSNLQTWLTTTISLALIKKREDLPQPTTTAVCSSNAETISSSLAMIEESLVATRPFAP